MVVINIHLNDEQLGNACYVFNAVLCQFIYSYNPRDKWYCCANIQLLESRQEKSNFHDVKHKPIKYLNNCQMDFPTEAYQWSQEE